MYQLLNIHRILVVFFPLILVNFFQLNCGTNSEPTAVESSFDWRISSPESQGFNPVILNDILTSFARLKYLNSLLMMRNGFLVVEEYYNLQDQESAHNVHSVSKSFTSAMIGIAIKEGFLTGLDQKMMDFFPDYASQIKDPRKYDITLEHLITMQAGFDWYETEDDWREYAGSPDWVQYALTIPLQFDPGTSMHYATPQTNLLAVILARASGKSALQFAEQYLFTPLQISIAQWYQDPQGYYTGGHEMYFIPRHLIKFGYLYLNHGVFNGKQVVPADWIDRSVRNYAGSGASGYGYGWWIDKMGEYSVYSARGRGGQYILVVPDLQLIIVTTTDIESWAYGSTQARTVYGLMDQIVVDAIN